MMNLKKILAVSAFTLSITSLSLTTANAAEFKGDQKEAAIAIIKSGFDGEIVVNNLNITASTPINAYLTEGFISEINYILGKTSLGQGQNAIKIVKTDNLYSIQNKLLSKKDEYKHEAGKDKLYEDFCHIKYMLLDKLEELRGCDINSEIIELLNEIISIDKHGKVTIGTNSNNSKTISLEDKSGNIIVQVNSEQINKVIDKVESIESYDDLVRIFNNLKPLLGLN